MVSEPGFESWPVRGGGSHGIRARVRILAGAHFRCAPEFLPTEVHTMGLALHRPVDPTCPSGGALTDMQKGECWTIDKASSPLSITNWF
jgi:hypothetical protein